MANSKITGELRGLARTCAVEIQREGISIIQFAALIEEQKNNMELREKQIEKKTTYRKAMKEELSFKEATFKFFLHEICDSDLSVAPSCSHNDCRKNAAAIFSEIITAAKMLITDGKSFYDNNMICDVIWSNSAYKDYSTLYDMVACELIHLRIIAHKKCADGTWIQTDLFPPDSIDRNICYAYLDFLAKKHIK